MTRRRSRERRAPNAGPLIAVAALSVAAFSCTSSSAPAPSAERGSTLFVRLACTTCHSVDGSPGAAPTMRGLAGRSVELADGTNVVADESYLRQAITDPDARLARGYQPGVMARAVRPSSLTTARVDDLVAYIESLR